MSTDSHTCQEESHVKQTGHEQQSHEPSPQLPTREYLDKIHKADLQKRCRELGITKVWVNKNELIDMILNKIQQSSQTLQTSQSRPQSRSSPDRQLTHPDVTPMSTVTDVPHQLPSCEAQLTSNDDVLSPDSEDTQPRSIPPNVNQASTIDPVQTLGNSQQTKHSSSPQTTRIHPRPLTTMTRVTREGSSCKI